MGYATSHIYLLLLLYYVCSNDMTLHTSVLQSLALRTINIMNMTMIR